MLISKSVFRFFCGIVYLPKQFSKQFKKNDILFYSERHAVCILNNNTIGATKGNKNKRKLHNVDINRLRSTFYEDHRTLGKKCITYIMLLLRILE